jgi:hypothetical protein
MRAVPTGRTVALPAGQRVLDLDVDPQGRYALVVTGDGATTAVWRWRFDETLERIESTGVQETAFSAFDETIYLITQRMPTWEIARGTLSEDGRWTSEGTVYSADARLSSLAAPLLTWSTAERVFFAREAAAGSRQVLSARRQGGAVYEVTSPNGTLGPLTDRTIRELNADKDGLVPPIPLKAASATPLGIHPATGMLLWADDLGRVHAREWKKYEGNWGKDSTVSKSGREQLTWSPNGWFAVAWEQGRPGVTLVHPAANFDPRLEVPALPPTGRREDVPGPSFKAMPSFSQDGRTLVGWTDQGLVTMAVPHPLAPVRHLWAGPGISADELASRGMSLTDSEDEQLYQPYDLMRYEDTAVSTFVSIDGMLEVLHAGFQAVFLRVERDVSIPRLEAFLVELERAAAQTAQPRVQGVATAARRILHGDYDFEEGQLVQGETRAMSPAHGEMVDFADFHPRGPYATSPTLSNYFRAFKYIDALQLTDDERASLMTDGALGRAWAAWTEAQAPFLSGTRYQGMLGDRWMRPGYVSPECLPKQVLERPRRAFPLSWGRDSEILERVVAHDELGPSCTVPLRTIPSGLDLLTALGSPEAAALQQPEYEQWPSLAPTHAALRRRFGTEIPSERFTDSWLRLVQVLTTDTRVPEGVSTEAWRRRLMETALASWASFRHTTVLVNEGTAAEYGAGGDPVFEEIVPEPPRGAVDPVPNAWAQLSHLLTALASSAASSGSTDRLGEVLSAAAASARDFGSMAERQMRGEGLTEEEYSAIDGFAGAIEHPYLLLSAAAAGSERELVAPDPMMRIVDIHTWNDPLGPPQYWHVAVGRPRLITVLLGDRGVLVPAEGAIYGYYEVVDNTRWDDARWRGAVDSHPRPAWVNR